MMSIFSAIKGKIIPVLIGIIGVLIVTLWYFNDRYERIKADNAKLELAIEVQGDTITELRASLEKQTKGLKVLADTTQKSETKSKDYLKIFVKHDLTRLAAAKPVLIENRMNKGTVEVFDGLEDDSNRLYKLNN